MNKQNSCTSIDEIDEKIACATLDLENNWGFNQPGLAYATFNYISDYIQLINHLNIPVSIFVVGKVLEEQPETVSQLRDSVNSDFHLHSYNHHLGEQENIAKEISKGKAVFENFFGHNPQGYRAPQGRISLDDLSALDEAGFCFDSSIFPSYRPGVYNNLTKPTTPYEPPSVSNLLEMPLASHSVFRIPISMSYLKLFGRPFLEFIKRATLPSPLIIDSHLQDFYHTPAHEEIDEPLRSIYKRNLNQSEELFKELIEILKKKGYEFETMTNVYNRVNTL